jgi:hypothetical protein
MGRLSEIDWHGGTLMALQMSRTFNTGITASQAYHKLGTGQLLSDSSGYGMRFEVKVYYNASARTSGKAPIEIMNYFMTINSTSSTQSHYNPVKSMYEYLKSLSEYSGATDV